MYRTIRPDEMITCTKCGSRHKVGIDKLKYTPDLKPFVCGLCSLGIEFGDKSKLERFILKNYSIQAGTVVDFIIARYSERFVALYIFISI